MKELDSFIIYKDASASVYMNGKFNWSFGVGVRQCVMSTILLTESEMTLQRRRNEFDRVCKRRKLKVNAGKSKDMVSEWAKAVVHFTKPYRVNGESTKNYRI